VHLDNWIDHIQQHASHRLPDHLSVLAKFVVRTNGFYLGEERILVCAVPDHQVYDLLRRFPRHARSLPGLHQHAGSQISVIASEQMALLTANRKAVPLVSFRPFRRTSLAIWAEIDFRADHLQRVNQGLKRIGARAEKRTFLIRPVDLISANPHAVVVFGLKQTDFDLSIA
jgi:hypothetical protein